MRSSKNVFQLFLLIIQIHLGCCGNISCITSERIALLDLKKGLTDEAKRLSMWYGDDCCTWDGVGCNSQTGHVMKLNLSNPVSFDLNRYYDEDGFSDHFKHNCLGGEISPSLLSLQQLQYLDLSMNNFSGTQIPEFFSSMKNLEYLNLSSAGFGGKIPEKSLGNLSNLQYLHIGYAPSVTYSFSFSLSVDSLSWLVGLHSLKTLDLSGVDLHEAQDWLNSVNMISHLMSLSLAGCGLYAFPPLSSINLTSLLFLNLQWNSFNSSVPVWMSNFTSLEKLYLDHNSFDRFTPESFNTLPFLSVLDLSSNLFEMPLPKSFCNLKNIVHLDLSSNSFRGVIPSCFGDLTSLTILNLGVNLMEGSIPDSMMNLCSLQVLDLSLNRFSSALPVVTSGCLSKSLKELYFVSNGYSGYFPIELENYKNLEIIHLSFNLFFGSIPFEIGRMSNLRELDLSNNRFSGSLPSSLGQLSQLVKLDISNNSLSGVLSEVHFEKLTKLKDLSISLNSLLFRASPQWDPPFQLGSIELASINAGPEFPPWLQTQKQVRRLIMPDAGISDSLPAWFENVFSQIDDLDLSRNNIRGKLPVFEESRASLRVIKLSSNRFEGQIFAIPLQLYILDLSENMLGGTLSQLEAGYYVNTSLNKLILCNNFLTGEISEELCGIQTLTAIDLSGNYLSGTIPGCLANLKNLQVLDLSNNSLTGEIPISLGFFENLHALHLQQNKLSGKIPSSLRNLKSLHILDIGENGFQDVVPMWIGEELHQLVYLRIHSNGFYGGIPLQLCRLNLLRLLDLGGNNLSGSIPHCLNELGSMVSDSSAEKFLVGMQALYYYERTIVESTKGADRELSSTPLTHRMSIDLSDNNLNGEIPKQIMELRELKDLNLSGNNLKGSIPWNIGNLQQLESLDLSRNELSGRIPSSLSTIFPLSYLDLSFNHLSGPIPTGNQLQTLNDPSSYEGNDELCGAPLPKTCPSGASPDGGDGERSKYEYIWFYAGIGPGFSVGFVVASCIVFMETWRVTFLLFLNRTIQCCNCRRIRI